jgi:RNA polymerase sigma factor (sigma-70 family)
VAKAFDAGSRFVEETMADHLVFQDCDDAVKQRVETYWGKKLPRLKKLLADYGPELYEIRLTVAEHRQKPSRVLYELRGVIHLPSGTLVAEANDPDPHRAIDKVVDTLDPEIVRHKELVRKDFLFKRKARQREDLNVAASALQRHKDVDARDEFVKLLRPLLQALRSHARRELRVLEIEGSLQEGEAAVDVVLDDLVELAWQQFRERPRNMSLRVWLTDLLHETLEQRIKQQPRTHEHRASEAPQADDQRRSNRAIEEDDIPNLSDLAPGWESTEAWDNLQSGEQSERLMSLLSRLPTQQRQAFMLYAIEDFKPDEIAMIQDRTEAEVSADIEAAQQTLKERSMATGKI